MADLGNYRFWLNGSFGRGLEVSVDGETLTTVSNEISAFPGYVEVDTLRLDPGVHTFTFEYPSSGLAPGSGNESFTTLSAISLEPLFPARRIVRLAPERAEELCGESLDWIELVREPVG